LNARRILLEHPDSVPRGQRGQACPPGHRRPAQYTWFPPTDVEHPLIIGLDRRAEASHETIINLTGATTTSTGLIVTATLDTNTYPTGIKISDQEMQTLPITRDPFHGEWNYTLHPTHDTPEPH
jgi:Rhodopirellula transposase DDE domain